MDEPEPQESFTELFGELATDVATLVRQEVSSAANEMAVKIQVAGRNVLLALVGALLGAVALLVLVFALVLALGSLLPMWLSAFVIAAILGGGGYALYRRATAALGTANLLPTETFASLAEDASFAKHEIEATRDQMSATLGEVRRRLELQKPKRSRTKRVAGSGPA